MNRREELNKTFVTSIGDIDSFIAFAFGETRCIRVTMSWNSNNGKERLYGEYGLLSFRQFTHFLALVCETDYKFHVAIFLDKMRTAVSPTHPLFAPNSAFYFELIPPHLIQQYLLRENTIPAQFVSERHDYSAIMSLADCVLLGAEIRLTLHNYAITISRTYSLDEFLIARQDQPVQRIDLNDYSELCSELEHYIRIGYSVSIYN